ncbi:arginase family protein [Kiloniella antarctica]|uniref:Arginase family protein n=1 Tax=Kiloniella antarctica TaxID=1550907 RepID=A0ABW5BHK1_9PROT
MPDQVSSISRKSKNFMGVKDYCKSDNSQAVIMGLPFDCGTDPIRIGARHGPKSIRTQSQILDPYIFGFSDINPLEKLNLTDFGDLDLTAGKFDDAFEKIETALDYLLINKVIPVTFGGDGMVSLPQMRAMAKHYKDLVVLHFDAHSDAYPIREERYNTATTFTCAAHEKLIDTRNSYHIGCRGPASQPALAEFARQLGYRVISMDQLFDEGPVQVINTIKTNLADRPVYLCWDMDFFDASCVPGVCEPTWGGPSAREGLSILKNLSGLNIVGIDINTVCPPHDQTNMSAHLAANVALLALHLIARD